jgi:hypothetical protein
MDGDWTGFTAKVIGIVVAIFVAGFVAGALIF